MPHLFHLRDFVYLMRFLRKKCTFTTHFVLTPEVLLRGLQRNFNGINATDFNQLVKLFFDNVNKVLDAQDEPKWAIPANLTIDTFVELIQDRYFFLLTHTHILSPTITPFHVFCGIILFIY
jgi:hypothetical protein